MSLKADPHGATATADSTPQEGRNTLRENKIRGYSVTMNKLQPVASRGAALGVAFSMSLLAGILSSCGASGPNGGSSPQVFAVSIDQGSSLTLQAGGSAPLSATVSATPGVPTTVTWASYDPSVASVSSSGLVTANSSGSTKVLAMSTADTSKTDSISISITRSAAPPTLRGEWVWIAVFPSGSTFEGYLSVSETVESDPDDTLTNVQGGVWRWCVFGLDNCSTPSGVGLFAESDFGLVIGFADSDGVFKLFGADDDGQFEVDEDGTLFFIGSGEWFYYSGGSSLVDIGLARFSQTPVFSTADSTQGLQMLSQYSEPVPTSAANMQSGVVSRAFIKERLSELVRSPR